MAVGTWSDIYSSGRVSDLMNFFLIHLTFITTLYLKLSEGDLDPDWNFVRICKTARMQNLIWLTKFVFSSEARFCLNEVLNRHNCHIWSGENPI